MIRQKAFISFAQNMALTSAVLRLECSIDCISGSVGQWVNKIFSVYFLTVFLLKKTKFPKKLILKM